MLFAFPYLKRFGSLAACLMTLIGCMEVAADEAATDFFEKQVRPVLVERCFKCHSAQSEKLKGGLLLDSREGMIKGGDDGSALSPGSPEKSRLIEAISYSNVDLQMPPKGKLPDEQIKALTDWVKMGAPWPAGAASTAKAAVSTFDLHKRKSEHWAWQPLRKSTPPIVENDQWSKTDIDKYIRAKLKTQGLSPALPADKRTLIRRATFDLIGLPPTPAEVDTF
ncbi:MAG: hypothetical protein JWM99_1794, partial [Verrucomicrobiales bacterium]|nr:hypothetical protein [Verrucomicrobiales bacterium]